MFRKDEMKHNPELYKQAKEKHLWVIPTMDLSDISHAEFTETISNAKSEGLMCDWEATVLQHLIDHIFQQGGNK